MSTEENSVRQKKTISKPKTLTAKKKVSPAEETAHKKKKLSPESDAPKKKKKSSPESDAPKKKKKTPSPESDTPKKKKKTSSPESDTPKKKKKTPSPESDTPKKEISPEPEFHHPPEQTHVKKTSSHPAHKKKKFRLKRGVKVVLFMFCAVCIFCGVVAFKNTRPSPVEADTTLEDETSETESETLPETTEEPTTEEITEEPTTEIDENAPFIDYELEIDPDKPMIAITYDDGPSAEGSTAQILDTLEEYHAHATFFIVGKNITPETESLIQREVDLGCEVANHSWEHDNLEKLSLEDALESLKKCDEAIYKTIKRHPQHIRPPYGAYTDELREADGRMFIYWSLDTSDWKWKNAKKDYEILMDNVGDGDIILMHDIHQASADASDRLIPDLIDMGYQLVTVSELMYYRGFPEENGMVLFNVHPDEPLFKSLYGTVYQKETEEDSDSKSDFDSEEESPEDETAESASEDITEDVSDSEISSEN